MNLYEKIIAEYPELENSDIFVNKIILQNDSDEVGDYIAKWEYSEPLPKGLKLGKPKG
jgi:hypothetical protein